MTTVDLSDCLVPPVFLALRLVSSTLRAGTVLVGLRWRPYTIESHTRATFATLQDVGVPLLLYNVVLAVIALGDYLASQLGVAPLAPP